ncbi:MAG: hypothetical protein STHCBS139747_007806 [Sporothrix thermara]
MPVSHKKPRTVPPGVPPTIRDALLELVRLGRRGHWVLHTQDIYCTEYDTRPQTRNPSREVKIHAAAGPGQPLTDTGLVWAGDLPAPCFDDPEYWQSKRAELVELIALVKERRIRPAFTAQDLAALEEIEQKNKSSVFHAVWDIRTRRLAFSKAMVLGALIELAELGRPGQWILHTEAFYHPDIDTRPLARKSRNNQCIIIPGITSRKLTAGVELRWDGKGSSRPDMDMDDDEFWSDAVRRLSDKMVQVREGRVHPSFSPAELRELVALEGQKGHYFAKCRREAEQEPGSKQQGSSDKEAVARALAVARSHVRGRLVDLWNTGLAGRWVLHGLAICAAGYSTRYPSREAVIDAAHESVGKDAENADNIVCSIRPIKGKLSPGTFDLYYRGAAIPPAELDCADYWLALGRTLDKKLEDVYKGRIRHEFTTRELRMLELADHSRNPSTRKDRRGNKPNSRIKGQPGRAR